MANGIDSKLDECIVSVYTRADALSDGVLVDVSEMAREAGICYPTAITRAVYERHVRVPENVTCQDEEGRLWDILSVFCVGAKMADNTSEIRFSLCVQNDETGPTPVKLRAVCGPGDFGEPVITVMLPDED